MGPFRRQIFAAAVLSAPICFLAFSDEACADDAIATGGWTGSVSTYSWLPWLTGDIRIRNVDLDVDAAPRDILENLDWSTLPVWMSYSELKNGRVTLFNDIVWSALEAGAGFEGRVLAGSVEAEYRQLTVEVGAAYQVYSARGSTIDLLAGGRYWRQETNVFLQGRGPLGLAIERSGSVDWVDPFVGARLQHAVAPGQSVMARADIGGFSVGSDFTWQAMATFNMELCEVGGNQIDAYFGYRALSVDYSENAYAFDAVQHGPILGLTMSF
jgi:hypothetical protein